MAALPVALRGCPSVIFKNVVTASLNPTPSTRLNLARQADGSYTSYETDKTSPFALHSASPHFEQQLTACLPARLPAQPRSPIGPANPAGAASQDQAVALLSSGNYLIVSPSPQSGATFGMIDAAVFDPQMNLISVATYPAFGSLLLADLNGDGLPDIVSIQGGSPHIVTQVLILLGNGGSSFQAPIRYEIGIQFYSLLSVAIGDLNGDGKPDIVVAGSIPLSNQGGTIYTFMGNGDGTFQPGPSTQLAAASTSIALADLDGDGRLDLAFNVDNSLNSLSPLKGSVGIALGNGDGTFAMPSYSPAFGGPIAIGDMNADGIPDIVTFGAVLFGDGKGSFPKRQNYAVAAPALVSFGTTGKAVILADIDGDGRRDIVLGGGTPALLTGSLITDIFVMFGQQDGTFLAPPLSIAPELAQPDSSVTDLHTADFNRDGIPDLAYAGAGGYGVGVMIGKGDGTFTQSFSSPPATGSEIVTGDFNGDGNPDIVALFYTQITFLAGKGDGTFQAPVKTSVPAGAVAIVSGDFNGDAKLDVAVLFSARESGVDRVILYLGNGDGSFRQAADYPAGPNASWLLAGDLNRDGKLDLVVTNSGSQGAIGNVGTLLGNGDGTFVPGTPISLAVVNARIYGANTVALADLNEDGTLDLAVATTAGLAILPGKGDGTFQPAILHSAPAGSITVSDLNDDGLPDLIVLDQYPSYQLFYMLGNGDGSFEPALALNLVPLGSAYATGTALVAADLNGDGKPDLVSSLLPGLFAVLNLTPGPPPFRIVSSAILQPGPVAANSFVSAIGSNLPPSTDGLSIVATDSAGVSRPAEILYASPTQINFLMPAGTSDGVATVTIAASPAAPPLTAQIQIVPIAPGLFTKNTAELAAAYVVHVDAQGGQSSQPVFQVKDGTVSAAPIDLGPPMDQVYLIVFGTGFDHVAAGDVNVTVADQPVSVVYSGPQGLPGLDQVNVLLPHGLEGSGDVSVVLTAGGAAANRVHITIQ